MKKIPSVFQRNYETDHLIRDEVVPGCEWVLAGEGVATRKWDGTCCLVRDGTLYKRYDAKKGKTPPEGWEPCEPAADPVTGHWPGWLLVGDSNEDRWHRQAFLDAGHEHEDGTYELVGPKVQANVERRDEHCLIRHHGQPVLMLPSVRDGRSFLALRRYLERAGMEGIVFHHPDGRMAKVKTRDFGLPWPRKDKDEAAGAEDQGAGGTGAGGEGSAALGGVGGDEG